MVRLSIPLALPRRRVAGEGDAPNGSLPSWTLCCPLAHLLVVVANSLQLAMMITFLCLLLWKLNDDSIFSWFSVFTPLWASDAITVLTSTAELRRICNVLAISNACACPHSRRGLPWPAHAQRQRTAERAWAPGAAVAAPTVLCASRSRSTRRNGIIAQLNRLKGSVCVSAFKFLLAMREEDVWASLTVVTVCSPYFLAALLRLGLHLAKKPVAPADGSNARPTRPGPPFNPVHLVILLLACRADGLNHISWTATFWPLWTVFGLLGLASIAATVRAP